jgi:glycosyltransferase involved in cell wall biosynthesis
MKKLLVGVSAEGTVVLLEGQMKHFKGLGYDTYLMGPYSERLAAYCEREGCKHLNISIKREISLLHDLISLFSIMRIFIRIKPDIINLGTPKVSLLGMIAGKLLGIKKRIYTCRGYRFEHEKGLKRKILVWMEKITAACAHKVICISPSVREFGLKNRLFPGRKTLVIHKGSSNGIPLIRFDLNKVDQQEKENLQKILNPKNRFVFGFVGRIFDRKGIDELYAAFSELRKKHADILLMVVGRFELSQIADPGLIEKMKADPAVILTGPQPNVPLYMTLMDVFVFPAWGEGFGNVLVQAAAMGLPVISTTGTGSRDAVGNGFNGLLVPPKAVTELIEAMDKLYSDKTLREELGQNGLKWARHFDSPIIWEGMEKLYKE